SGPQREPGDNIDRITRNHIDEAAVDNAGEKAVKELREWRPVFNKKRPDPERLNPATAQQRAHMSRNIRRAHVLGSHTTIACRNDDQRRPMCHHKLDALVIERALTVNRVLPHLFVLKEASPRNMRFTPQVVSVHDSVRNANVIQKATRITQLQRRPIVMTPRHLEKRRAQKHNRSLRSHSPPPPPPHYYIAFALYSRKANNTAPYRPRRG